MSIQSLILKQFRCFGSIQLSLDAPIILIKGRNGTGKTSLLEALYFAGSLRSFRTHNTKELIAMEHEAFNIKINLQQKSGERHELSVGFEPAKKLVRVDDKKVSSFKDLFQYLRVMCISEDDLSLIKGSPEERRSFIDGALLTEHPESAQLFRRFRHVLASRNALLKQPTVSREMYAIWTRQLWELSTTIQQQRHDLLERLEARTNDLVRIHIPDCPRISCRYQEKNAYKSIDELLEDYQFFQQEHRAHRSLFGAHLDDILISFDNQASKVYASRGQQKLTVLMLKVAHLKDLQESGKVVTAFLLDDFTTDFDERRMSDLLQLLTQLDVQLIFTCPTSTSPLESILEPYNPKKIELTN